MILQLVGLKFLGNDDIIDSGGVDDDDWWWLMIDDADNDSCRRNVVCGNDYDDQGILSVFGYLISLMGLSFRNDLLRKRRNI